MPERKKVSYMTNIKEECSGKTYGEKAQNPRAAEPAAEKGRKDATLNTCNPSVCVGGAQPTSCVCPTPQKK